MSSPREATPSNGIVEFRQRAVGPIRLPEKQPEHFLKHFNEVYLGIGLRIAPNPAYVIAPEPPNQEAVSIVAIGSDLPIAGICSSTYTSFTQARTTIVDHLSGALREAMEGPKFGDSYFLEHDQQTGLIAEVYQLSCEQAHVSHCGQSIAAQVQHLAFAMDVAARAIRGDRAPIDWSISWQCNGEDQAQWDAIKKHLSAAYRCLIDSVRAINVQDEYCLHTAVGTIAHVAYHIGSIRQLQNSLRR